MSLATRFSEAAKVFFAIGQKGDETVVAEIENGKPKANQVYRCINAARGFLGYGYCCPCGGFTLISGGRFTHQDKHRCSNCGRPFCIDEWFKSDMQMARTAEAKDTGRPEKTGAFTHAEETLCESRLPYHKVGLSEESQRQAKLEDLKRQINGGQDEFNGIFEYEASGLGADFGDPFAARHR